MIFAIGGVAVSGQSPNDSPTGGDKADRADAYYHYMLARMYATMASSTEGRKSKYADKAAENYKAALKADPRAASAPSPLSRPLFFPLFIPRPPASPQGHPPAAKPE